MCERMVNLLFEVHDYTIQIRNSKKAGHQPMWLRFTERNLYRLIGDTKIFRIWGEEERLEMEY